MESIIWCIARETQSRLEYNVSGEQGEERPECRIHEFSPRHMRTFITLVTEPQLHDPLPTYNSVEIKPEFELNEPIDENKNEILGC